jgi:hypothetical protein
MKSMQIAAQFAFLCSAFGPKVDQMDSFCYSVCRAV